MIYYSMSSPTHANPRPGLDKWIIENDSGSIIDTQKSHKNYNTETNFVTKDVTVNTKGGKKDYNNISPAIPPCSKPAIKEDLFPSHEYPSVSEGYISFNPLNNTMQHSKSPSTTTVVTKPVKSYGGHTICLEHINNKPLQVSLTGIKSLITLNT